MSGFIGILLWVGDDLGILQAVGRFGVCPARVGDNLAVARLGRGGHFERRSLLAHGGYLSVVGFLGNGFSMVFPDHCGAACTRQTCTTKITENTKEKGTVNLVGSCAPSWGWRAES